MHRYPNLTFTHEEFLYDTLPNLCGEIKDFPCPVEIMDVQNIQKYFNYAKDDKTAQFLKNYVQNKTTVKVRVTADLEKDEFHFEFKWN